MLVLYSKKPRKSKSSEIYNVEDMSFFLYNTKSLTKENCLVFINVEPYPLLMVADSNEKAKTILGNSKARVRDKMANLDLSDTITLEEFIKPIKKDVVEVKEGLTLNECQAMQDKIIMEIKNEQV